MTSNGPRALAPSFGILCVLTQLAASLPVDFTELSLEELSSIQVTSVSKKSESLTGAAAAIFVLSGDDIRRSGATSIPEALRLVPGLHVARVDAHTWAITARGFNGTVSDKLEVLLDGRSLYTPFFSGVFWDAQDTFIEDIDRIEVIRGPGATLWGANAVNGVINIVTRSADETQGLVAQAAAGNELEFKMGARYGGELGSAGHWRAYAKTFERDGSERADGAPKDDGQEFAQAGFRADLKASDLDSVTLQGDVYSGSLGNAPSPPSNTNGEDDDIEGYNLMATWVRSWSDDSDLQVKFFVDHTDRFSPASYGEERDTYSLDFTHRFQLTERQELIWGGGYRRSKDMQDNPPVASGNFRLLFLPAERTVDLLNVFVQDHIALTDKLDLTLGTKIEENDFTGTEVQPSARFAWHESELETFWGAVSRAVRTPNRLDDDFLVRIEGVPGDLFSGNRNFESEELIAYEAGYRLQTLTNRTLDIALFVNDYDELRGVEPGVPFTTPSIIVNNYEGRTRGAEFALSWPAGEAMRFWASYTYLDMDLRPKGGTADTDTKASEGNNPRHQALLRMQWNPADNWEIDGFLRYVDELDNLVTGTPGNTIGSYTELNVRIGWQASPNWELALVGQNLLDDTHTEFGETVSSAMGPSGVMSTAAVSQVERSLYAMVTWRPGRAD